MKTIFFLKFLFPPLLNIAFKAKKENYNTHITHQKPTPRFSFFSFNFPQMCLHSIEPKFEL